MSGRVRVALAGAGWVTRHHLEAYRELEERVEVVAIADPDVDAARERAARYSIPGVFRSVEAMLEATPVDALDVAAPREAHAPLCRLGASHGCAILCQKPLAPTLEEAEELVAELGSRVRLMVHENWRFRPHYRRIRGWLREGRIGEVRSVDLRVLTSGLVRDSEGRLPALVRQPMMAGLERMLLMEVMIHHVDVLRFLLGPLRLQGAILGRSCEAIRGEDRAMLQLAGPHGVAVSLMGDFMAWGHPAGQADRLEILGSEGSVVLEEDRLRLLGSREESLQVDLEGNYRASYREAIAHFLDRLADGGDFETAPEDNLETLRIVEAAYGLSSGAPGGVGGGEPGG